MWQRFLDFFYPALCELCQSSLTHGRALCSDCLKNLPRVREPFCSSCAEPFEGAITDEFQCPNCHKIDFTFDFARACLSSSEDGRQLVHAFKYQRRFHLAPAFSQLIQEAIREDPRFADLASPLLVPVPLFWWRQQKRTANQAMEIAQQLKRDCGYELIDCLKRTRSTLTQTKLPRRARLQNLADAFEIRPSCKEILRGRTVLLIDDVFTTGATAEECSRVLKKESAAARVIALTLLRG